MSDKFRCILLVHLLSSLVLGHEASGQCLLANPSFEIGAGGGQLFGGWNQFGAIGSTAEASHGNRAAIAWGPNNGTWDVSGLWQPFDTAPGERWVASVCAWHPASQPLLGQSEILLNIEWRDAGDNLISFESHTVANASTPTDAIVKFSVESGPAPAGTAKTRLLLGVLQSPTDPQPAAFFDQATFENLGPPTVDDRQWLDFPGERTIDFAGRSWRTKGPGFYGPGPNLFSDDVNAIWVDPSDQLHMTIRNVGGSWYSTEVVLEEALGYGDYVFTVAGPLDMHQNAVLGLFLWEYGACYAPELLWWNPFNEIDVELSRWGNPANDIGQFVAQPFDWPGNISRYDAEAGNPERTTHAFRWLPDRIEFRAWRGGPGDEAPANLIHNWSYTGPHIPRPDQPRVHINLWQFSGPPGTDQEAIIESFTFEAACWGPLCVTAVTDAPRIGQGMQLSAARPNPFNDRTTIRFALAQEGDARIAVFDVAGRLVRTLVNGAFSAGSHEISWDRRDTSGGRVAPGVYLYRLQVGEMVDSKRVVVLE